MQLSRDGDQAIRILPLFDFPEEYGKPAESHKSTIFGVSVDANILHREDELYKRSNYEQFGRSELFTHFPVILAVAEFWAKEEGLPLMILSDHFETAPYVYYGIYPLTPPAVRPAVRCFSMNMKRITTGIVARRDAAKR